MAQEPSSAQVEQAQEHLVDFHEAVKLAHQKASVRVLQDTARELAWLDEIAHSAAEDAWHAFLTAVREGLQGQSDSYPDGDPWVPAALYEQARRYWHESFRDAVADLFSRVGQGPEDLQSLGRALGLFFEELARATEGLPRESLGMPGGAGECEPSAPTCGR